jgi:hypothetical protein
MVSRFIADDSFLRGVGEFCNCAVPGDLQRSIWNTPAWIFQGCLASISTQRTTCICKCLIGEMYHRSSQRRSTCPERLRRPTRVQSRTHRRRPQDIVRKDEERVAPGIIRDPYSSPVEDVVLRLTTRPLAIGARSRNATRSKRRVLRQTCRACIR